MEPSIIVNNNLAMIVRIRVIHAPHLLKMPEMQEFITVMTLYNTEPNSNPRIVSRNIINGATAAASGSRTSAVDSCTHST